jgi:hypothetical protein
VGAPHDIVDELVHQFSDPYAFYRELIQNSIDAGSPRVEVVLRYRGGGSRGTAGGTARIEVTDRGGGMDRALIEKYFLTKFRSSKSGDASKIGKFGIGFVSVFAMAPEVVIVETGRGAESWRVVLHPDHRWELYRAEEARQGTRVILEKEMGADEYRVLVQRSRDSVWRWCRHAEVEVTFAFGGPEGSLPRAPERVSEPFTVDAPVVVTETTKDAVIVCGPSREDVPAIGFYNRGLTLYEAREALVPGITFKVGSPKLGHTLTRDDVRRDRGFERLIARVARLAAAPLAAQVRAALRPAAEQRSADYLPLIRFARERLPPKEQWFPLAGGGVIDGRTLAKDVVKHGLLVGGDDALATAARHLGAPVVLPAASGAAAALTAREPVSAGDALLAIEPIEEGAGDAALCRALAELLGTVKARSREVRLGRVLGRAPDAPFILLEDPARAERREAALRSPFDKKAPPVLCLDAGHELVAHARKVAAASPALAAALLCRRLAASEGALSAALDARMTEAALAPARKARAV